MEHDCSYSGRTFYMAMYYALYILSMKENLIPPFVVRRQGNVVILKLQVINPTKDGHCMILDDGKVQIPFKLDSTTSYFCWRYG